MNQSQILVDQNNQYMVTPGLANSSSASSTPSSSCSSGRAQNMIGGEFDFLECANSINLVDKNSLMGLNMMEFHNLNQSQVVQPGGGGAQPGDMVEEYWLGGGQYVGQAGYGEAGSSQVVMMPPPPMPSSSSTPSSSSSSPSPTPSAPKRAARAKKKPPTADNAHSAIVYSEMNAPKPPLTGYQHYFKERQSELRSQDSSLKFADIVKKVGTDWSKNIDKETKNGLQDKERYRNELKAYQSNMGEQSPKMCKKEPKNEPDEAKLTHLHTPPPSNDSCSPTSLSPNWLNDCCLFTHRDYFNIDAYHSKIVERSLLTQNEIKYLKQKLHQIKLDNKKMSQIFKNSKCELEKKHGYATELGKTNATLKSQLGLFKSLVHSCLLNQVSPVMYQTQPPASTTPNSIQYQYQNHSQVYQPYNNQSPQQQQQQQQQQYYMDSASVYNQQIQLQLQQNQYSGQYYPNNVYMQQQQQQQQYMHNGEIYQDGWMASQARPGYEDPAQYGQFIQQHQQQVYQQHQSSQNQNSLQASTTS